VNCNRATGTRSTNLVQGDHGARPDEGGQRVDRAAQGGRRGVADQHVPDDPADQGADEADHQDAEDVQVGVAGDDRPFDGEQAGGRQVGGRQQSSRGHSHAAR
jgi:hypothetical protein